MRTSASAHADRPKWGQRPVKTHGWSVPHCRHYAAAVKGFIGVVDPGMLVDSELIHSLPQYQEAV